MQPKRDPADRRFWPARLGGTGAGFTRGRDKTKARDYYGALGRTAKLGPYPRHLRLLDTVPEDAKTADPEAVRVRARLLSLRLMDRIDDIADSMVGERLTEALNAAGKLTGAQSATVAHQHQHRLMSGEDRAQRAAELIQRATSRLLIEGPESTDTHTSPDPVDAIPLPDNDIG